MLDHRVTQLRVAGRYLDRALLAERLADEALADGRLFLALGRDLLARRYLMTAASFEGAAFEPQPRL